MFDDFKFVGRKMFEEGLISSNSGSLSVRYGDKITITKSSVILSELSKNDLFETNVKIEGENDKSTSMALPIHRLIYTLCEEINAIVFINSPKILALAVHEEKIVPLDFDGKQNLRTIPVVRVRDYFSNDELTRFLISAFKSGYPCAVIRGFGAFAVGKTLLDAYKFASIAERSCEINMLSKACDETFIRKEEKNRPQQQKMFRSAIPPSIGVMDRTYKNKR